MSLSVGPSISKSTKSFGDFRGCRPLGDSIANAVIIPRFLLNLSPLFEGESRETDHSWQYSTVRVCVCVCVCVRACVCACVHVL